jgi:tRNA threonylcarbamoyladenosine biosynthesis protein TsaE
MSRAPSQNLSFHCPAEDDTLALAAALGRLAWPGLTVSLSGGLGAGKTVFARGFARGLGIDEAVTSPSYPIIQEYRGRLVLHHMDWYRLGSADEVLDTGAGELLDGDGVCLVEWPERAPELLSGAGLAVTISILPEGGRRLSLRAQAGQAAHQLGWPAGLPPELRPLLENPA